MDRVSKASELQKQLYRQTCTWVRQQGGLPTYYRLTRYCVSNSRAMAPSEVDGDTAERIGRRVANYINRNHDSTIANPAPAKPGHVRASERERILLMYRKGVADGEPPSIGQIVSALGVSKGLVQRTLAAANYNPLRARNLMKLSASARVVVQLLDRVFPSDGRRVMVLDELLDACLHSSHEINHDQYRLIASEINEAAIGIQLFSSEMVHPNSHRELLIVERGRRSSRAAIEQWLSKHISRHKDRGRLGLPPRIQLTFPYKVFYNPVARDLASVIAMETRHRDLSTWRDFIFATTGGGNTARAQVRIAAHDMPKIAAAAANFVRLSQAREEVLVMAAGWVSEPKDSETAAFLFGTALHLISSDTTHYDKLKWWIDESEYRKRLAHLGDRNREEFDQWIASLDPEEDIWRALLRLEHSQPSAREVSVEYLPSFEDFLEFELSELDIAEQYEDEDVEEAEPDYNIEGYIFPPHEDD